MIACNQILHGDCTHILPTLSDGSVDFILTDPPYGVRYRDRQGRTLENDDDLTPVLNAFGELHRVLRADAGSPYELAIAHDRQYRSSGPHLDRARS